MIRRPREAEDVIDHSEEFDEIPSSEPVRGKGKASSGVRPAKKAKAPELSDITLPIENPLIR